MSPRTPDRRDGDRDRDPERESGAADDAPREEDLAKALARGTETDVSRQAASAQAATATAHPHTKADERVAEIAHDLKHPLQIIMLESSLLEHRLGTRTTPAVHRGIERITQNAAYIDRLISDLLDAAAAEAGRLVLRPERVDMPRLLVDAIDRAVSSIDRGRVHVEVREVLFVMADPHRIERVVSNLVANALKYSPAGGLVTVRLDRRGAYACVSVIDSGPGLSAEQARTVFDRYRRGGERAQEGYGLGLYTSRTIIEAHRGRIGVASTPGRGSRFYFELAALNR